MNTRVQHVAGTCLLAASLAVAAPCAAEVYKWVDKDGKVQYSDAPPKDAATKSDTMKIEAAPAAASGASGTAGAAKTKTWQEKEREFNQRRVACKSIHQSLTQLQQFDAVVINGVTYRKADVARVQALVEEKCHGLESSSY